MLLAAGFSRRFGSDKRRHRLADGTPLLLASARLYAQAFGHLVVVVRPDDRELADAVTDAVTDALADAVGADTVHVVICPDAHLGMGHSLASGVAAARGWDYLFVALADMAWVRPATLQHLRRRMEGLPSDAILQPTYRDTPGHPVGFGADQFPALEALTGDAGARRLLQQAGPELVRVAVDDPGVLEDLDTPESG